MTHTEHPSRSWHHRERVQALAIFGRKKSDSDGGNEAGQLPQGKAERPEPVGFFPEKAVRFFEHAKTVGETGNLQYALQLWLSGLRQDPTSMHGLESFLNTAASFSGKPGKDLLHAVDGKSDVDRYAQALLNWGLKIADPALAVKAVQAAAKLDLAEQTYYIGEMALKLVRGKPKKPLYTKLMEAFSQVQAFDLAVQAGDAAVALDPADGKLAADVRNMSASATMNRGGFDQTGQEGGFRKNIRNADEQRQLEEADRIVKSDETIERLVADAEAQYQQRPTDLPTIQTLSKRLLERARPEDEQRALKLLLKAYEDTKQFRLRQDAGKIKLRQARRALAKYRKRAEDNPDDERAQKEFATASQKFTEMEVAELKASVNAYPTDLSLKYELGKRYFDLGKYDESIGLLQEAKNDARYRSTALLYLAKAFMTMDWNDEAIATFRQALDNHSTKEDKLGLELRYGLMKALGNKGTQEHDLPSAEEAEKIASSIAIEQFNYEDIRAQREKLKALVLELKQTS